MSKPEANDRLGIFTVTNGSFVAMLCTCASSVESYFRLVRMRSHQDTAETGQAVKTMHLLHDDSIGRST